MGGYVNPGIGPQRSRSIADLILRRGDIAAQRAARSGDIWANALAGLGQTIGGAVQQYGEQKDKQREEERVASFFSNVPEDPEALLQESVRVFGPEGVKIAKGTLDFRAQAQKAAQGEIPTFEEFESSAQVLARMHEKAPQFVRDHWSTSAGVLGPGAQKYLGVTLAPEWSDEIGNALSAFAKDPNLISMTYRNKEGQEVTELVPEEAGAMRVSEPKPEPTLEEKLREKELMSAAAARGTASVKPPTQPSAGDVVATLPDFEKPIADLAIFSAPEHRRKFFDKALSRAENEEQRKDLYRKAVLSGEFADDKRQVDGRRETIEALKDLRKDLESMEKDGINTGFLTGTFEDVMRKIGKTTDPRFAKYKNKMKNTLVRYRRAATGVQFSPIESADYEQMFPNYRQEMPVNTAVIEGMLEAMDVYDRSYWEDRLGSAEAADWIRGAAGGTGGRVSIDEFLKEFPNANP